MPALVPGPGFTGGGQNWIIHPPPSGVIMGTAMPRKGTYLNIYEMIAAVPITAIGTVNCGTPPIIELITSVSIAPCSSAERQGKGVTVLSGGVGDIPEMQCPTFNAPQITYNTVAGSAPSLTLPACLTGYYTEKYLWDAGIAFSEVYKGPEHEVKLKDNLRSVSRGGLGTYKPYPRYKRLKVKDMPTQGGTLTVEELYPKTLSAAATSGTPMYDKAAAGSNYLIGYPPSLIKILRFFFTIKVTHTCPPYVTYYFAHCDVENNWDHHAKRTTWRASRNKAPRAWQPPADPDK